MKKTFSLFLLIFTVLISACAPRLIETPASPAAAEPAAPEQAASSPSAEPAVATAAATTATVAETTESLESYTNNTFGLSFQYPVGWFGPDEYVSDQTLRVAVGSDVVYPYGTDRTEQVYTTANSYSVVVQYSQNDQNQVWVDTHQTLANLHDRKSVSDARSMLIRVRQINLGRFEGFEYISTLSETAQTEPVYIRQVTLFDDQSNVLTIMGSPNNVPISSETGWRTLYESVDEANLAFFHQIVESITIE